MGRDAVEAGGEATDITFREWGWPPRDGLITAVGVDETARRRSKRSPPGVCFLMAGWEPMDKHSDGRVWLRAPHPVRMAKPSPSSTTTETKT